MRWVRYFLIVILFCSCHSKQIILTDRQPFINKAKIDSRDRWEAIAVFVKNHFDVGNKSISEIAADLSLAYYYHMKRAVNER